MQIEELESKIVELEKRVRELAGELSVSEEWQLEIRELLVQLLQILQRKQELSSAERPRSTLENSSSSFSNSDTMLEKCVDLIFRDYRDQFKG
jgi:predicted GTPase